MAGSLHGIRVLEIASIGPGPHAAMMLSDMGAEVVRVERPGADGKPSPAPDDPVLRGRLRVALDLKSDNGIGELYELIERADVLIEGFRPGTTERLGFGPEQCARANPGLIYGRMTGWGQYGPLADSAGHDINYIALTGALHSIGPAADVPPPPLNLVGDFGGGSTYLTLGIVAALVERARSGLGQVVDAAMVDGVSSLMQMTWSLRRTGIWNDERSSNSLDGTAPFYRTYRCGDGRFVAVGAIEPQFYAAFVSGLGIDAGSLSAQRDRAGWTRLTEIFSARLAEMPRDYWEERFSGTDACVTPVLALDEVESHPHNVARGYVSREGRATMSSPAPRLSRTPSTAGAEPIDTTVESIGQRWHNRSD
ncbi:CaiB/BaiF CoA-transferase family protein [Rhodococcus sp. IEGM 1381]|uniref:CaiB/BaiF CoA transferase family protein n=1 Tax=Rhodococcus sp. IEGM 1381 TaxID=3047085 RepID=UPI0024B6D4CC|nr:CaiB/BaiF CoA-transferase family protein [Rhodococcus sp. IEGM 1381]MDI9894445.1 CaiB/BaiF CoA-transferase family protein [Rhodococcus sp. IEGM 1381]